MLKLLEEKLVRCNIAHLEPTEETIDVSGDAESIKAALADL